jgi:hypothetical protein
MGGTALMFRRTMSLWICHFFHVVTEAATTERKGQQSSRQTEFF